MKTLITGVLAFALVSWAHADSGSIDWNGWRLNYSTDSGAVGLAISDVHYKDRQILYRASFPVMRVQYRDDVCGPYADILWSDNYQPIRSYQGSGCNGQEFCTRTFTQGNDRWLELGVNSQIGEYQIYQAYYFHPDGYMDSLVFSRGLQCIVDHNHHAHWLFDFDIDGYSNDQIARNGNDVQPAEFNDQKSNTDYWTISDTQTGLKVEVYPGNDDGTPDAFSQWDVAARRYHREETGNWLWGPRGEIGDLFMDSERLDDTDVVFWYVTHLDHRAIEGHQLWHYSGPRLRVVLP